MEHIPITISGEIKLLNELYELKKNQRPKIINAIQEARKHGDLKENAEYHAAREEQGFCESRIRYIETILSKAHIIDIKKISNTGRVIFGSTVTIYNIDEKKKFVYRIVGDDESNFKKKLISINSPVARALIGKEIDDIVLVKTPRGIVKYQILMIQHV
ncbi:transcription elongation factor GreA [Buchnera aphidicola (Thelaxes californica)]|uniref:Transcription elongation factor GreA n=1 Tax=Buchnera aphidicola (Thelaxes californica) TaxID=1315998 RepID=A0A4D6YAG7_9GAMM|nr:transcription elongation factor GreA [Buchnera aphidicola (Thelaxes californica)]